MVAGMMTGMVADVEGDDSLGNGGGDGELEGSMRWTGEIGC